MIPTLPAPPFVRLCSQELFTKSRQLQAICTGSTTREKLAEAERLCGEIAAQAGAAQAAFGAGR